ncbi:DUF1453 domain-containing protein [Streptomyces sp. NPDC093085]|uniref:DUF1453 domain-containing protein n=1 Tax=Streptomyces sp. NPDC093085 TaxID=3155068 RepID=UPI00344AD8DB
MSSLLDVLVIAAVIVLVVARQVRPQRIGGDGRRWFVLPVVLGAVALRQPGLLGTSDRALSLTLLCVELLVGVVMGAGWAWTSRIWTEPDGSVWSKGTRATVFVWIGGIAIRLGLMGGGALLGVHQGSGALMLGLAASLLVRGGVLTMRASTGSDGASYGRGSSYGGDGASAPGKERV